MYSFLEEAKILPKEQKGCKRNSRGTIDQVLLDKAVPRDCKMRSTNLAMTWINYQNAYMIPHNWISECHEVFGVVGNTKNFLVNSISKWKLDLTSRLSLGTVEIRRGIFQGNSLSPLLFVYGCIIIDFKKIKIHYEFSNKKTRMNDLLFMDDLKLFGKSNDQIDW